MAWLDVSRSRGMWIGIRIVILAAVVSLAAAGSADASSIFFLRGGNIWVANPDGSAAKQVTTDGSYDFVSSAKQGSAPLAFHRGGNSASQFGTVNPDGSGETINPYNSSMSVDGQYFTRLNDAGNRMTWPQKCSCASLNFFAASAGTSGSLRQEIYNVGTMDARDVTFGDPAGDSLLFTDVGNNYTLGDGHSPCNGTDDFTDILVLQTPPPSGSNTGPNPTAVYCDQNTFFFDPALRPDGQLIAAESESNSAGPSTQIVTIPIGNRVNTTAQQTTVDQITPPNSGDTLPDFSPDGSKIVFQGPNNTIDTVPAGGGAPTQILTDATVPAWSPYTLSSTATHVLTVSLTGNGKGTVTGSSISCPGSCSHSYATGTSVTLAAAPASCSSFAGWSGACSGGGACTVLISSDQAVTARFALGSAPARPSHTKITKAKINARQHTASFGFSAHGAKSFQCELIPPTKKGHKQPKLKFSACRSPKTYTHLKAGKYTFLVRGVNATAADRHTASKTFTID